MSPAGTPAPYSERLIRVEPSKITGSRGGDELKYPVKLSRKE